MQQTPQDPQDPQYPPQGPAEGRPSSHSTPPYHVWAQPGPQGPQYPQYPPQAPQGPQYPQYPPQGPQYPPQYPPQGPQAPRQAGGALAWFRSRSRGLQAAIGCGALIAVCAVCSLGIGAINAANGGNTGNTSTSTSTSTPAATDTPAATATPTHAPVWTTVQTFSGNGDEKTASFTAPDDWRLVWSCDPSSSFDGQYNVIVSVTGSDGTPLDPAAVNTICKAGNTSGTTEERQVSGSVYLDILSEGAWTFKIQVLR